MKQNSKRKNKVGRNNKSKAFGKIAEPVVGRRNFLRRTRNAAIGISAAGGIGFLFTQYVRSEIHEHDLARIGNGKPTVVQIHDPQCSQCLLLQKKTRQALENFTSTELDYVVADIRTQKGREFAGQHRVQHITLLLFDKSGSLKHVLRGQRSSDELKATFQQLL